jgi:AI-2 transport protein TqsA
VDSTRRNEQIWLAIGSLMILAAIALAFALVYTKAVMIPFVLAIFIATVVSPVVDFLVLRWKIPPSLAVLLALVVVVTFLGIIGLLLTGAVQAVVSAAGQYASNFSNLTQQIFNWLKQWKIEVDHARILNDLQERLPGLITQAAGTGTALIAYGFLITFFVIFLLAGRNSQQVRSGIYAEIECAVRRYIFTKFAISAVTGILVWIILSLLGLRLAMVFALLAFLLNFIPSIGSVVATLLPLPMALAQYNSFWPVIGVVAIPGAVQMVIGNAIEPKLMGRGLELHPVTVLMALAFWGLLWGYLGMVLAVPITAVIRIVLIRFETTRAIGDLLGGHLPGRDNLATSAT